MSLSLPARQKPIVTLETPTQPRQSPRPPRPGWQGQRQPWQPTPGSRGRRQPWRFRQQRRKAKMCFRPSSTYHRAWTHGKACDFSPRSLWRQGLQTTFLLLGGASRETWLTLRSAILDSRGGTYSLHSFTQEAKYFLGARRLNFH